MESKTTNQAINQSDNIVNTVIAEDMRKFFRIEMKQSTDNPQPEFLHVSEEDRKRFNEAGQRDFNILG